MVNMSAKHLWTGICVTNGIRGSFFRKKKKNCCAMPDAYLMWRESVFERICPNPIASSERAISNFLRQNRFLLNCQSIRWMHSFVVLFFSFVRSTPLNSCSLHTDHFVYQSLVSFASQKIRHHRFVFFFARDFCSRMLWRLFLFAAIHSFRQNSNTHNLTIVCSISWKGGNNK